jgi:N utilization substance protein B
VKGRRQARRAALQGLYELDQSDHALEVVLAGRVSGLCESALDSALQTRLRRPGRMVLAAWDGRPLDADAVRRATGNAELPMADAEALARVLNELRPQVAYLDELMRGVLAHVALLDATIHDIAPEWPVEQMAPVDRNVLRIALWELGSGASPTRVAINEAVELARAFSGEGARRMVNGALGTFAASGKRLAIARGGAQPLPMGSPPP